MSNLLRNIVHVIILFVQSGVAFGVALCTYMIFALMDYTGGFPAFVGLVLFQPILASILTFISMIGCLIIGLPIRVNASVRTWWMRYFILSPILALTGALLLIASLLPAFADVSIYTNELDESITRTGPNVAMATCGWFAMIFGILHTFPPLFVMNWFEGLFIKRSDR